MFNRTNQSQSAPDVQQLIDQYQLQIDLDLVRKYEKILKRVLTTSEVILLDSLYRVHGKQAALLKLVQSAKVSSQLIKHPITQHTIIPLLAESSASYGVLLHSSLTSLVNSRSPYIQTITHTGSGLQNMAVQGTFQGTLANGIATQANFSVPIDPVTRWVERTALAGLSTVTHQAGIPHMWIRSEYTTLPAVYSLFVSTLLLSDLPPTHFTVQATDYEIIVVQLSLPKEPKMVDPFLDSYFTQTTQQIVETLRTESAQVETWCLPVGDGGIMNTLLPWCTAVSSGIRLDLDSMVIQAPDQEPIQTLITHQPQQLIWIVPTNQKQRLTSLYTTAWQAIGMPLELLFTSIGKLDRDITIIHQQEPIVTLALDTIQSVIQEYTLPSPRKKSNPAKNREPNWTDISDIEAVLPYVLRHPAVSRQFAVEHIIDTSVQGTMVVPPGSAPAGVLATPIDQQSTTGVAVALNSDMRYALVEPYWQGVYNLIQSVYRVIASGAVPQLVQLGSVLPAELSDTPYWKCIEHLKGSAAAAQALGLPVTECSSEQLLKATSTLNSAPNEYFGEYLVTTACVGLLADTSQTITFDFIQPGNYICVLGDRKNELGGSILYQIYNEMGKNIPQADLNVSLQQAQCMQEVINEGLVPTCLPIGPGGLATSLAQMCCGGAGTHRNGMNVDISSLRNKTALTATQILFSETPGFVFEVDPQLVPSVQHHAGQRGLQLYIIGTIRNDEECIIKDSDKELVTTTVGTLCDAWHTEPIIDL